MLTFAYYLLKVSVCSGLLFSYYFFTLRNKQFHQYNRFYLLGTVILSWIIPLAKIEFWQSTVRQEMPAIKLLKVVATGDAFVEESLKSASVAWDLNLAALVIFSLISGGLFITLVTGIVRIGALIRSNPNKSQNKIHFIFTEAKGTPFSFFKYIFWNKNTDLQTEEGKHILRHELTHVQEKHSADKIFLHIVLVAGWLNPFFWLIRKELNMIHEFIADQKAISDGDTSSFSTMLLKTAYPQHSFSIANSFFHSPIKRRLIMFTTSKKPRYSYLRRLMILPLLGFVIVFFAFKAKEKSSLVFEKKLAKAYIVVIDAGHGGNDDGAISAGGLKEKDITLMLAKTIKAENTNDNIKIVLSRENDAFLSPPERIQLLEKIKPDVFISLHVNTASANNGESKDSNGPEINIPKGSSTLIEQSRALGSILSANLETVFNKKGVLKQRQQKIWVLDENKTCPSILVEFGYMSSTRDMALLSKTGKQEEIAQMLLKTIEQYLSLKETAASENKGTAEFEKVIVTNENRESNITNSEGTNETIKIKDSAGRVVKTITDERINTKTNTADTPALPKALVVLDGAQMSWEEFNKKAIAPEQIKEMNVLKDKPATDKYGEKGANGVIEIITKGFVDKGARESSRDTTKPKFNKVFTRVENPPYYSRGMAAFAEYIQKNLQYPKEAIENKKEGAVSIQFIIDEEGKLSHFKKVSDVGFGLEEEAIRLIKNSSGWNPGIQNGHKVPVEIVQQIIFRLPGKKV